MLGARFQLRHVQVLIAQPAFASLCLPACLVYRVLPGLQKRAPAATLPPCRAATCGKPFSFLLRPRHHCRCCGLLFCSACTTHMLLPPKFRLAQPQRVCGACAELLLPVQPLLAGSVAAAVHQPVHDVTDWSAPRSLLNPPLSASMGTSIYVGAGGRGGWAGGGEGRREPGLSSLALSLTAPRRAAHWRLGPPTTPALHPPPLIPPPLLLSAPQSATNILRQYVRSVGSLQPERRIPPAILRSCAGLAVLSVARVGAGWGVSVGSGVVVARSPEGGWSAPSALLSLASSLGWQIGVEVQDLVLVLRSQAALKAFCSSQLGVGGGASVAAGPVGRAAAARALAAVGGGAVVYSYSSARGCYAGVALEGIVLRPRDAVNQASPLAALRCVLPCALRPGFFHAPAASSSTCALVVRFC